MLHNRIRFVEFDEVSLSAHMVQFMSEQGVRCRAPEWLWYRIRLKFHIVVNLCSGFEHT